MNSPLDKTLHHLNDCGCCEDIRSILPVEIYNRPGLPSLQYRIGNHASFKRRMLSRLSSSEFQQLQDLKVRDENDFVIALIDAWAMGLDILTFYQERISNEAYLRTATEQKSTYYLANLIGYSPRPGVAASSYVAFIMETADGTPSSTEVPEGTKIQSIPGPGETPQFFETIEAIIARPEWNDLSPLLTKKQEVTDTMEQALLEGVGYNFETGNVIVVVADEDADSWQFNRITKIKVDNDKNSTLIDFKEELSNPYPYVFTYMPLANYFTTPLSFNSYNVSSSVLNSTWNQSNLTAFSSTQNWSIPLLSNNLYTLINLETEPGKTGVFGIKQRAAVFGHNAPKWSSLPAAQRYGEQVKDKDNQTVMVAPAYPVSENWDVSVPTLNTESKGKKYLHLDAVYEGIGIGAWVILKNDNNYTQIYKIDAIDEVTRADFAISAKVTRLKLNNSRNLNYFNIRNTSVYITNTEPYRLAAWPLDDTVPPSDADINGVYTPSGGINNKILLDRFDLNLTKNQNVVLTGENANLDGVIDSEVLTIDEAVFSGGYTELTFVKGLKNIYKRDTVSINANIAAATHGETKTEVLGNGNAAQAFQTFKLKQPPLTYISAQTPSGAKATLTVKVNNIKWTETSDFRSHDPADQVYVVRTDSDGETYVHFGDGINGSRLPTGQENIVAEYRQGMGREGQVGEKQLNLLITKPLGIKSVTNPIAASGAEDRESRDQARNNAPLTVLTLDRIVSLHDYENFAKAFAGVSKALATWTWDGRTRGVFITVSGPNGDPVNDTSATYKNLLAAIKQYSDPLVPVWITSYQPVFFIIEGNVKVDPQHEADFVLEQAKGMLRDRFSFNERDFGQNVTRSEVNSAIQKIPGVIGVKITVLERVDDSDNLIAKTPRPGEKEPVPAELLLLDERPIALELME
jgi:hypothetical protein